MLGYTHRWGRFTPGKAWFGLEHSLIGDTEKYLERWIIYVGGGTLRLHKFWQGDDDRAPHDHPWWFVTFPLRSYEEIVVENAVKIRRTVKAFRFHYRSAKFRHIVIGAGKPFYTFVITGTRTNAWGFWPGSETFIPWREWK